jgi:hypothetical protein
MARLDLTGARRQHRAHLETGVMMAGDPIPDDVRRFLMARRLTVPHVEAILLLRREPQRTWDDARLAARLYVAQGTAASVLTDLGSIGLLADAPGGVRYDPADPATAALIDRLDETYAKNLVEVARLIHSTRDRSAEEFAAAFRFRKE